ncbi:MAG: imidazoleglycerol-phosphate dehydratase HisB [Butyricicoccus pullicaecorum]|nr:imidazoleglycerol-phosphate dehydratase HisB [Butyricicoccus pullicaecorum]MDO4668554.1 imidazoleglycerol-phosphate dehydratase HisB [Butyricicoccus pullicaecorum]
MRHALIERNTKETQIQLELELDGVGKTEISTGCGFLNHMLEVFARHGDFDLTVHCQGDTDVDDHHSVEDVGICLGQAFCRALGDKRGIVRYGQFFLAMDEALILCACDLSGRDYLGWVVDLPSTKVGSFDTELVKEFWLAFVRNCPASIHIRQTAGENTHHIIEAIFKGMGRTLKAAAAMDPRHENEIPSTKGVL